MLSHPPTPSLFPACPRLKVANRDEKFTYLGVSVCLHSPQSQSNEVKMLSMRLSDEVKGRKG